MSTRRVASPDTLATPCSPKGSALYKTYKLGLALKNRGPHTRWTVNTLSDRLMDAEVTFPRGAPPAKAKLVDLIHLTLKAAYDRICAILAHARDDKVRAGGTFVVQYVLTVPAGWDQLAKAVMRRAAERAGEARRGVIGAASWSAYVSCARLSECRPAASAHVICARA